MKKLDCKFIGLSTPDRSKMSFRSNIGPPINTSHVREWSKDEFEEYISNNFRIVISEVVDFQDHYIIAESLKQRT